ncbi:MAG: RNA polymerase subunit sigma-70 [Phocaeicola sp.]
MHATISADIVSSTSLTVEETIELKQKISELFQLLEADYPGFWGRQIKGDYLECYIPNPCDAFRIALILKSYIKSFQRETNASTKKFDTYGVRIAIGIGAMRIVNQEADIMDGEAIYHSGRALDGMGALNKGTMTVAMNNPAIATLLRTVAILTDGLLNSASKRQNEVLQYKLLKVKEQDIAHKMGIKQSSVNEHSSAAKWYCIEEAVNYVEQLTFEADE